MLAIALSTLLAAEPPAAVGARAAYAFRPHVDGRSHGAAAQVYVDVPVWGPFALRLEGQGAAWGASVTTPTPIALGGGALQLLYSFDETDTEAIVGVGPFVGASIDGEQGYAPVPRGGVALALSLRMPLLRAAAVEVHVGVPFVLVGPTGLELADVAGAPPRAFPFVVSLGLGLAIEPLDVLDVVLAGENPFAL